MSNLIGRFYLKLTDSKNLIGEFSNNILTRNYTESADRISPKPEDPTNADGCKFIGKYFTTWHEEVGHECVLAELEIKQKTGCENIYSLEWQIDRKINYWGEGMVCDGMLIGDYRNFPNP